MHMSQQVYTCHTFVLVQAASPAEQCTRQEVMKPPWPTVEFINGCSALRKAVPAVTCHKGVGGSARAYKRERRTVVHENVLITCRQARPAL